jgi:hypothetical protein
MRWFPSRRDCESIIAPYFIIRTSSGTAKEQSNMTSRRYQSVLNRQQELLLAPCVDDYISLNNPVRAIDAYVNTVDLQALAFTHSQPVISAGQPAYDPAALLRWFPSSSLGTQCRKLQLPEQLTTPESPQSTPPDRHNHAHWNSANAPADPHSRA